MRCWAIADSLSARSVLVVASRSNSPPPKTAPATVTASHTPMTGQRWRSMSVPSFANIGVCKHDGEAGQHPPCRYRPSEREMIMRWTSEVPSPISRIFASRHMRATGVSFMKP